LVISIIAALGIISITWFKGSFLINGLDRSFPPDRTAYFIRGFYAWDIFQLGAVSIRTLAGLFPANIFLYVTEVAGLSLVSAEKLWFYLLFVSAGFSMYFLSTTVYCGKYYRLVGLVSAVFHVQSVHHYFHCSSNVALHHFSTINSGVIHKRTSRKTRHKVHFWL
jgi:hypothetical protein